MSILPKIILIVPCFNESERLLSSGFMQLIERGDIHLLFVNDGSTDNTQEVLETVANLDTQRLSILSLERNQGKGAAVRAGLLCALGHKTQWVGYIDADLATPPEEVLRLCDVALQSDSDAVLGSRILHLGHHIDRKLARHLLGRVFATAASLTLDMPIYDTQCGAKLFRVSESLVGCLEEPFHSRWAFDVELIGRLVENGSTCMEVPLKRWVDVAGSKVRAWSMVQAAWDLVQIRHRLKKRRNKG